MNAHARFPDLRRRLLDRYERRDAREFLPAALEVMETPASPAGRLLAMIIVLFFVLALAWAIFGQVDIQATAPGRVLPIGEVKAVQSLSPGLVQAIHVQNGDHVRAGQVLLELDPTETDADRDRLAQDLAQADLDAARLTALRDAVTSGKAPVFVDPPGATLAGLADARAAMQAQADRQAARIADLTQQVAQKQAETAEALAEIDKTNAMLPMIQSKADVQAQLTRRGYGSRLADLDAQQQLSSARHDLAIGAERVSQARDGRAAVDRQRDAARSQYVSDILDDLAKAQARRNELTHELAKAQGKVGQTDLRAPIDGVVEQLTVNTLHGVVQPAQRLMLIVPDRGRLMVEARLSGRDIGFVHAGQPAEVKVETFDFTRYGLLHGRVAGVSRAAVVDPEAGQAAVDPTAEGQGRTPPAAFLVRIAVDPGSMTVDGRPAPLQPGMAVTAEIRTGRRSILDFLLSPLSRRAKDSLHER